MSAVNRAPSVVVATHERSALLARLVAAVEAQEPPPREMVIVDDGSRDGTWSEVQRLVATSSLRLVAIRFERNRGPAAARNAGWRAATADRLVFTDDDCVPQPGWLVALTDALSEHDLAQGRTLPDPDQGDNAGPFSRTMEVLAETGYYPTCNIAYRREVLERNGGFDETYRYPAGEDTDLAWRALESGARSTFVSDAVVLHDVRPSSWLVHVRDTTRWSGVVLAVRHHPRLRERFHRRWFWKPSHPPALLALAGLVAAAWSGPAGWPRTSYRVAALALVVPYVRYRTKVLPIAGGRRRVAVVPQALLADWAEIAVLAASSIRYHTLLL